MKKLVLITMMLCAAWSVQAQSVGTRFFDEASALYYNITSDTTVEVTYGQWHFNTYVGDIVVPSTVDYEGVTYTVTAIGEIAFGGCEGQLNSVIVPNTVTTIGESAFASSPHLSLVILPNSIESFGTGAFARCYGMTSLRLPEGFTTISERMFFDCTGLTTIEIPLSVTRIEKSAFEMSYITHIDIPETVTYIGESAFESCTRLTSIDIPNSVTEIGPSAFYFCQALQSAHLPETLEVIPESLFERCVSLSSIDIPPTVTEIGKSAYCYTTSVQEVVIPDAVQVIGDEAFLGCSRLSSVTLSSHLGSISVGLFQDCTALRSIAIPQSVVSIDRNAFKQSGLVSITFEGSIDDIGGYAFSGCTSLKSIVLPTTAHIEGAAFYGCSNLETVVITGRVYEIRIYAFGECTALQTVTLLQSIPPLDEGNVFAYCNDSVKMIVPCGAKEAYENSDWSNEPIIIEEDCGDLYELCESPYNFGGSPVFDQGTYGALLWWNKPFASHWFHYDEGPYEGAVYCNSWGIKIPAEEIQRGDVLTHVAFYRAGGQNQTMGYNFAFGFEGETEPDSWDYLPGNSVQVEPGLDEWVIVKLGSPIACEEGKCLWIVLEAPNVMGINASYCQASGNPNACWSSEGSAAGDWMIRGYFTNDVGYNDPGYNEDLDHYNIYRGSSLEELEKIAEVGREEEEYFDTLQQPFGDYYYQLTASYTDGRESMPAKRGENPHDTDYVYFHVGNMSSLGSEWYYEILNEDGSITYQHLQYAADTTVNDKEVKIIIRTNTLYDKGEHNIVTKEYIYEDFGKVYWWNAALQDFTLLYDLGAQIGDSWVIRVGEESITMHVDAVEQYEYEGTTYRMLRVSDADNLFSGEIMSGIGHLTSFFPERLMTRGKDYRVEGIRCYWREGELVFKYGDRDCNEVYEEWHNGIEEDGSSTGPEILTVYPNPTDGILIVETVCTPSLPNETYRITNLMGQTLMTGQITDENQQIDVSDLPDGMYFITFAGATRKFVVR